MPETQPGFFSSPGGLGLTFGALGFAGDLIGGIAAQKAQTRNRRRQRKAIRQARTFAEERIRELTGEGTLFAQGVDFLRGTFGDAASSPLAQDFVKQIRAAQASRGTLFGGAAVAQEAGGLSAFSQQLRASLLPQLQSFSFAPEQLRQSILGFEAPLRIAAKTGGQFAPTGANPFVSALQGGIAGGFGGTQLGFNLQGLQQQQQQNTQLQNLISQLSTQQQVLDPALQQLAMFGGNF